jgi:hypothetical protein
MKKLLFIFLAPFLLTSCLDEGSNYLKYTGWINVDSLSLADSASVGDSVYVMVRGSAPNGCWSALELYMKKQNDSVYIINGSGTFESEDGICNQGLVIVDSSFLFKPVKEGKILFYGQSPDRLPLVDSLIVTQAEIGE